MNTITLLTDLHATGLLPTIEGKEIPGVSDTINTILGWILWLVSVASLFGLLFIGFAGFESYKNSQGEQFMEKAKWWLIGAIIGSNAPRIVEIFFPSLKLTITPQAIPGVGDTVNNIIGYTIWVLGIAAVLCILGLALGAVLAYRHNGMEHFVEKFKWFIAGAIVASFATTIAGAFFPAAAGLGA
ncbi:hypothetical protein ACIRCZ_18640 [Leifsonia sp. NPDC102414]|uniref:hypothetical protein n=1 Tax=Leifsonia sp. NPDC102414 TaxID=3364124 RepID=UPI0038058D5B